MILASHNSWTYLQPKRWWMRLIAFTARCQKKEVMEQYESGVRCFDLRLSFPNGNLTVSHGLIEYDIPKGLLELEIHGLDLLCITNQVYIRVLHEVRNRKKLTEEEKRLFREYCEYLKTRYIGIKWFCGRNLVDWEVDYDFGNEELTIDDKYASVDCKVIGWWPWLYAKLFNKKNMEKGTDKDILMIDFI